MANLKPVLFAIENIVCDDVVNDAEMDLRQRPEAMTELERTLTEKLLRVYELAHAYNDDHSCHYVHTDWRTLPESSALGKAG